MRLDRIQARGFLSHADTDLVLDAALSALTGANGAGKSSLVVDAPLFALYDDARLRSDDLVRLGATQMSVLVEFAYGGQRYRVTRGRSTASGGRSFLELAIADGPGWRPLTAPSIRETQQAIEDLLRLDAGAFETAVILVQGDAMRFADATPADRKRVLGQVLGLDVWERAEACAKERARTLDASLAIGRAERDRLDAFIAQHDDAAEVAANARAELERIGTAIERATRHRDEAQDRLRAIDASLADARAARAEAAQAEAQLRGLKERWDRSVERQAAAAAARLTAMATIDGAGDAEAIAARLPALREDVAAREATERDLRTREQELRDWETRRVTAERADAQRVAEWRAERSGLASRVATLKESLEALQPAQCPKCGNTFPADPADLRVDLINAEMRLAKYGPEPGLSIEHMKAAAQADRVRDKIAALAFDADALARLRSELAAAERAAGAIAGVEAARASIAAADVALEREATEQADIKVATPPVREARTAALARAQAAAGIEDERVAQERVIAAARAALSGLDAERAQAQGDVARAEARAEERERAIAERTDLVARLAGDELELRRLRRLVDAFGVKGIPARIIASVLPEFEDLANELLGDLRPGMTLAIRAQRARKAGDGVIEALDLAVRDAAGERPLAAYSGGERMSVSLAIAVALSRLVARRSGTAIRTLVIDEPDGLDADARRAFGQALRILAHRGELERTVLVSHHPDLAEVADAVYEVRKEDGRSVLYLDGDPAMAMAEAA